MYYKNIFLRHRWNTFRTFSFYFGKISSLFGRISFVIRHSLYNALIEKISILLRERMRCRPLDQSASARAHRRRWLVKNNAGYQMSDIECRILNVGYWFSPKHCFRFCILQYFVFVYVSWQVSSMIFHLNVKCCEVLWSVVMSLTR